MKFLLPTLLVLNSLSAFAGTMMNETLSEEVIFKCLVREAEFCVQGELAHQKGGQMVEKKTVKVLAVKDPDQLFVADETKGKRTQVFPITKGIGYEAASLGGFIMFPVAVPGMLVLEALATGVGAGIVTGSILLTGAGIVALPPTSDLASYPVRALVNKIKAKKAAKNEIMAATILNSLVSEVEKDIVVSEKQFKIVKDMLFNYLNNGTQVQCTIESATDKETGKSFYLVRNGSDKRKYNDLTKGIEGLNTYDKKDRCNDVIPQCKIVDNQGMYSLSMGNRPAFVVTDSESYLASIKKDLELKKLCTF